MARSRPWTLLGCLASFALLAAGCSGASGSSSAPVKTLRSLSGVAERSTRADTGRFEMALRMTYPGVEDEIALSASGAFDRLLDRMQMTLDMSAFVKLLESLPGGGEALGDPGDWKLELIQDKTVFYVRVPAFVARELPDGKTWVRGDASAFGRAGGSQLGDLSSFAGGDPRDLLTFLEAVSGDLQAVGREDVRGVSTSHYRATLDLRRILRLAASRAHGATSGIESVLEQTDLDTMPLEVWVDDDSLLRRMELRFAFTASGTSGETALSLAFDVFDYGKPLFIELPAADDVVGVAALR